MVRTNPDKRTDERTDARTNIELALWRSNIKSGGERGNNCSPLFNITLPYRFSFENAFKFDTSTFTS